MKRLKLLSYIFLAIVVSSFAVVIPVHAQNTTSIQNGFSISPPSFDINANPGDKLQNIIKIENITDKPLTLTAKVQSFVAYGNEGQIQLSDEDTTYAINSWVVFESAKFSVDPGQIKAFNFVISIPSDAQPGSHFGSIVFSTDPGNKDSTGAAIVQEIGSVILIKLPGDVVEKANINTFKSTKDYYTEPKVQINALVDNTGSVIVQPAGKILIQDLFGNTIQTIDVAAKNILPGSQRVFDQEFDFDKVGFFKAKLELNYGNSKEKVLTAETNFTTLYTQRLVPVIIVILVLLVLYFLLRKRINRALVVIVKG